MNSFSRARFNNLAERTAQQSSPEDVGILSVAAELCQELGVRNIPTFIDWAISRSRGGPGFHPSSDFLAADAILWGPSWLTLPKRMHGKLESEEWRPLLASSLIYNHRLRGKLISFEATRALLPGLLLGIPFFFLMALPGIQAALAMNSLPQMILWSFLLFMPLVGVSLLGSRVAKSLRLQADDKAGEIVGKEKLLSVLRKIQGMQMKELERWRPDIPKLSQRLHHLDQDLPERV